jgi:co-chaperonin GroES (HSP10)
LQKPTTRRRSQHHGKSQLPASWRPGARAADRRGRSQKGRHHHPDTAKEKPQEAKVIAIGTGKKDEDGKKQPFEVKVGDRVLISKYGGTEIKIDGNNYQVLREDDILGIMS